LDGNPEISIPLVAAYFVFLVVIDIEAIEKR